MIAKFRNRSLARVGRKQSTLSSLSCMTGESRFLSRRQRRNEPLNKRRRRIANRRSRIATKGAWGFSPTNSGPFFEKPNPRRSRAQPQQEARRPLRQLHHIGLEDHVGGCHRLIAYVSILAQEDVNGGRLRLWEFEVACSVASGESLVHRALADLNIHLHARNGNPAHAVGDLCAELPWRRRTQGEPQRQTGQAGRERSQRRLQLAPAPLSVQPSARFSCEAACFASGVVMPCTSSMAGSGVLSSSQGRMRLCSASAREYSKVMYSEPRVCSDQHNTIVREALIDRSRRRFQSSPGSMDCASKKTR